MNKDLIKPLLVLAGLMLAVVLMIGMLAVYISVQRSKVKAPPSAEQSLEAAIQKRDNLPPATPEPTAPAVAPANNVQP